MLIDKNELLRALDIVKPGLAKKEVVELTRSYLFASGYVGTFNDEISVSTPIELNIEGALKADLLYPFVKATGDEKIEIAVKGGNLVAGSPGRQVRMEFDASASVLDWIDKYLRPQLCANPVWKPLPSEFRDMLRVCLTSVSNNWARPSMCSVHWKGNAMESTDNFVVTRCILDMEASDAQSILIPKASAEALLKVHPLAFNQSDGWLHFRTKEGAIFSCRTMDYEFPDLGTHLALDYTRSIQFPLDSLRGMLKRAAKVVRKDLYRQRPVAIIIENGCLTVRSQEKDYETSESCPIHSLDTLKFSLDLNHLRKILEHPISSLVGFAHFRDSTGLLRFCGENFSQLQCIELSK